MKLDAPEFTKLTEVLAAYWMPLGNVLESRDLSAVFPHRPTVYLLSREGCITYIGQSADLKVRMAQHASNPRMTVTQYDTISWFEPGIDDLPTRLQIESILICACLPERNKALMLVKNKRNQLCEIKFGCRGALGRAVKSAAKLNNDAPWANQSGAMR